jgi:alginate O-acetyltransferase complex protein AlgI
MILLAYAAISLSAGLFIYWFVLPSHWRLKFLFAANICFMSIFSIKFALYFLFNVLLIYSAGVYMGKPESNKKRILILSLIWLIANLSAFKYGNILIESLAGTGFHFNVAETTFNKIALPMGMSYIVFRLIHYIVEMYRQSLPEHSLWSLGAYIFFFPTFIAGPVERFQKFHPQTDEQKSINTEDINYGLFRLIIGIVKKFFIADYLAPIIIPLLAAPDESSRFIVLLAVYGLAIQVYMDFSGYTDMALGISRLFGYKIVENFNYPFFKKNIALFWRSWHMSVYSFIRDYFFFPFFAYRASQTKIYIGILVTLVVFMMWHELSLPFLIVGVYHGMGLVIWQYFQEIKRKHQWIRKLVDNKISDPISTFVTFNFVSISMVVFYFDVNNIKAILYRIFAG